MATNESQVDERSALLTATSARSRAGPKAYGSPDVPGDGRPVPLMDAMSRARFVVVCAGLWSSNFVFAFQSTAIPTLSPNISSEFNHAELAAYLGSIFTLANTAVIPLYGVLMETLGRQFAMLTACFFFGAGTILCSVAPSMYWLIAARAIAGLGGGGMLTVSSVAMTDLVYLRDRGFYQGVMMTIFGTGSMLGGPISGWLADRYDYRVSFWIQIPIVLFCAIIVSLFLPHSQIPPTHASLRAGLASLDWAGSFLLIGTVTTLILGFSFHTSYLKPWSSPAVWGCLLSSVLGAFSFVVVEAKVERPLVPLALFNGRHMWALWISNFFLSVVAQAFTYHIPLYFAVILSAPTAVGGAIISVSGGLGLAIGSLLAGYHIRRGGEYKWLGVVSLLPSSIAAFTASYWHPGWPFWAYYLTCFLPVFGYAVYLCVGLVALISSVDGKLMPKAIALLFTVRSLGGTLGVSIGGSVQIGTLAAGLRSRFVDVPDSEAIVSSILHSKAVIPLLPPHLRMLAVEAYASSLSTVWFASGFVALLTISASLFIRQNELGNREKNAGVVDGALGDALGEGGIEGQEQP